MADPNELASVTLLPTGEYEMVLNIGQHPDPGLWGIVMADMLRHLANAYSAHQKAPKDKVVERILKVFRAEMEDPSGNTTAGLKGELTATPTARRKKQKPS